MSSSSFWTGKEVEGRLKGLQTLFIVGDQPIDLILEKLRECLTRRLIVSHLYFGAGGQSDVTRYDIIRYFMYQGYFITYELVLDKVEQVPEDVWQGCHIIACTHQDRIRRLKPTDTIKFETSSLIYCTTKEQFMKTSRDEYNDTEI